MKPLMKIREIASAINLLNEAFREEWYLARKMSPFGRKVNYDELLSKLEQSSKNPNELRDELLTCSESDEELEKTYQKMCEIINATQTDIFDRVPDELMEEWAEKYGKEKAEWADDSLNRFCEYQAQIREYLWQIGQDWGLSAKIQLDKHFDSDIVLTAGIDYTTSTATPNTPSKAHPNDIVILFKDSESANKYFDWPYTTNPRDWGDRFNNYGKPKTQFYKGQMKQLFDYIRQLFPDVDDDVDKFRKAIKN